MYVCLNVLCTYVSMFCVCQYVLCMSVCFVYVYACYVNACICSVHVHDCSHVCMYVHPVYTYSMYSTTVCAVLYLLYTPTVPYTYASILEDFKLQYCQVNNQL